MSAVEIERLDGCLVAVLNRPEVRNAVNFEMMDQLAAAIQLASEDEGVKAFVLTGAGEDAFCSGGDLREFHQLHTFQDAHRMLFKMSNVLRQLAFLPKPSFCFVNGAAVGGGLELATACDFRFVKKGARLGFIQVRQAITTGWGGGSLLLEKLDSQRALDWLMSGRIISVEEGVESRFIHSSMDTMEKDDMMNKLEPYMQHEGTAVMAYKEMLIRKWRETGLAERMEQEVERCALLWEKPAHLEAVNRFISK